MELVNKKSKALKNLEVEVDSLSPEEATKLLHQQPRIMHRPLFSDGETLLVGFKAEKLQAYLGK